MKLEKKSYKNLVAFLGVLKTPKIHSEIYWPLKPCATVVCTRPSRQKSAFSSVGPLYWDVGPWPSPARLGRPNMAQLGPTEPSLGQQLLQIANLSSFFFWQNRNVHDEGRAKWEHWTLLWHSYQQHGSPMHSKVPSLMQIKYIYYNPLQRNYRVELLHREISVVITRNVTFHEQQE